MSSPTATKKRTITGPVVKRSGDKTVSVEVAHVVSHRLYGKKSTVTKKYLVHDETNKAEVGSVVTIQEVRPLSARKRWIVIS